ncbi:uncharacterized protein LOC121981122 [Zingiber officinale]|uniref:uncharacterized protein LOC121981122 n=1 Tax=Zingiber officinale TaxID=94328 RepID=UPI001C4CD02D|nr:uncharacterized protein LOC121981122 [Zingiber officinale]
MHRHSLGSPATKPQPAGGEGGSDEIEQDKRIRWCPRADRSIHLIPLLTLLCLLVLYLISHNPSPKDLEIFSGRGRGAALGDEPKEVSAVVRASAVISDRGLKAAEAVGGRRSRVLPNRKMGATLPRRNLRLRKPE